MKKLSNISLKEFRNFLSSQGLSPIRSKGGHEAWMKAGMSRPVIVQSHIDPVPVDVVINNLRTLGISKTDFLAFFE
ncbi:MAG: type II toxin-antitoxin system HicA family toxin [Bacteroidales bacterium]|jgi:predicted RNA binding protein YcfA (HicA-like mRNA interferase family)|nr:type II toxin-antitoxin system HicA family toxin [Bacteroidales bacterium]